MSLKHGKLPAFAIADLFENLAFLLSVGHPMVTAVEMLSRSKGQKGDRSAEGISKAATLLLPVLKNGESLGVALGEQRERFGSVAGQIDAAEKAGKLTDALNRVARQQRSAADMRKKVRSALMMPIAMLVMIFGVCLYLFIDVLPTMISNIASVGNIELPLLTKIMMAGSDFVVGHWLVLLVGTVGASALIVFLARGPLKRVAHKVYIGTPVLGKVIRCQGLLSFYETLSYMMFAMQPLDKSLAIAAQDISNLHVQKQAERAARYYGGSTVDLGEALAQLTVMPEIERLTLTAGYQANEFIHVLDMLAKNKSKELDTTLNAAIEWLTPVTTIIIAVIAGVVALAVYTPILGMGNMI